MELSLTLRIVLESPPSGVDFGLQKGRGSAYETVQKQRSDGKDLFFECRVNIKTKDGDLDYSGPFVQGPPAARFIYIDIGTCAGQKNIPWSRRLKIPLSGISKETASKIMEGDRFVLETRVPGTGKDGSPSCATVKPFAGWKPMDITV